jgi:hypothetical protein
MGEIDWVFFRVSLDDACAFYAVPWGDHTKFREDMTREGLTVDALHVDDAAFAVAHGAVGFVMATGEGE